MSDEARWYKDAILYELHVRAFYDSDGNGVGDFRGLAEKLDYLQDLGVTAIWLLPFYPSPLRDDGYDIADYTGVHPLYGSLADFRHFLREAHSRSLRVITELVLNHTSDQHPWFKRARHAPAGSAAREFYVWSDDPRKYKDTRVIFKDFEQSNWTWDPVAKAYFWHRFYSHQPDLNFDHPDVRRAVLQTVDFWLGMGVDGLRLDAVPYLHEREGTNCENLPETHAFLKELRRHVDSKFKDRMLLAEANQWPEDAVAYFGDGDECHMAFHFPVMPRLFMAIHMEDRFPVIDILEQTPEIPEVSQWALFLRNHDELTLEMVTDEDRDYMYRVYATDPQARINLGIRRRLAPLLGNHRRRIELMNGLLFSLPGTPVIYYADEIGMGDNVYLGDRNGVRTPMQWSSDRNAGFSRANPQRLYLPVVIDPEYHFEAINVEAQESNPSSLLWWMKRLISLRKRYKAFGRGTMEFLPSENRRVLTFIRRHENECVLVVVNLSRYAQAVELDLSAYKGQLPVEMFGRNPFPPIGELPYFITLGPHAFYWFSIQPAVAEIRLPGAPGEEIPVLEVSGDWDEVFHGVSKGSLQAAIPAFLQGRRWFGGKARTIATVKLLDAVPLEDGDREARMAIFEVRYTEGDPEMYQVPLAFATGDQAARVRENPGCPLLACLRVRGKNGVVREGLLHDPFGEGEFGLFLLDAMARRRRFAGESGDIHAFRTRGFRALRGPADTRLEAVPIKAEQSNTSVLFGDRMILKLYRRIERGLNPDLEIGRYLTERARFAHIAPVVGAMEYRSDHGEPTTLGLLQAYVRNEGDAWQYTLDSLQDYFEGVRVAQRDAAQAAIPETPVVRMVNDPIAPLVAEIIGPYLSSARLLGQRTGELHRALASSEEGPAFHPEPFTAHYQRAMYQSMRRPTHQTFELLRRRLPQIPDALRVEATTLAGMEETALERIRVALEGKITALRTRYHGDYHLGQILFTGKDFVIIDFEGEPARPLAERRYKRSPLRDVAGMFRSFSYAVHTALRHGSQRPEDKPVVEPWAAYWEFWVSLAFLSSYLEAARGAGFLPEDGRELEALIDIYEIEKAVYELSYELNNRPDWVDIPIHGLLRLLRRRGNP